MPRYPIDRATNFIVEEESWTVVEYDHTSVPGVIYLSLTEGKVNSIYDDLENNIADTDKLADYKVIVPMEIQNFAVGDIINPSFTLTKNGVPFAAEVTLLPTDKAMARIIDGQLTAIGKGTTEIIVQLKDYPTISETIQITIDDEEQVFSAYIEGAAAIRLDREAQYTLVGTAELESSATFTIDTELATIIQTTDTSCVVRANDKNKLGSFTLTANYNNIDYTKEISIIPLW